MLEFLRPRSTDPLLTKCGVSQNVAKGCLTLVENFLPVSDEQQPSTR